MLWAAAPLVAELLAVAISFGLVGDTVEPISPLGDVASSCGLEELHPKSLPFLHSWRWLKAQARNLRSDRTIERGEVGQVE